MSDFILNGAFKLRDSDESRHVLDALTGDLYLISYCILAKRQTLN